MQSEEDISDDIHDDNSRQTPMTSKSISFNYEKSSVNESNKKMGNKNTGTRNTKKDASVSSQYAKMIKERQQQWESKLQLIQRQVEEQTAELNEFRMKTKF